MKQAVETGWNNLFQEHVDTTQDVNFISTKLIRKYLGEVRLVTKMDSRHMLPAVFSQNKYFLLPLTNGGDFAIVRGDGFHDLERTSEPIDFVSQLNFELSTLSDRESESKYIDYAYHTGLIETFLATKGLYLTIRGRQRSKPFSFNVGNISLKVTSVQVEVDAGFESPQSNLIAIFEAKVGGAWRSFNIRQLYYPMRIYMQSSGSKKCSTVFFVYEPNENKYSFWEYEFTDTNDFLSISLKRAKSYYITQAPETITVQELHGLAIPAKKTKFASKIPQADDFSKIAEFPFKIKSGIDDYRKIAKAFKFDTRQSSYYRQATEFLGLVKMERAKYLLTDIGDKYVNLKANERNALLGTLVFQLPIVNKVVEALTHSQTNSLSTKEIVEIISQNSEYNPTTARRRAQTIISWFKWLENTLGIFSVSNQIVKLG